MKEQVNGYNTEISNERDSFLDFLYRQIDRFNNTKKDNHQGSLNIFTVGQNALF